MKELKFPTGFIWGTSTAGHQVEGDNRDSNWWNWEKKGLVRDGTLSGRAVDYWNRFEDDHALMSQLDFQGFRLGIEWARIEPEPGRFSEGALARYRNILCSLRDRGIKICLTLNHWVLPHWVSEQNDWLNPQTIDHFARFVERLVNELGDLPDFWVTLNEPMMPAIAGNLLREHPPQRGSFLAYRKVCAALLEAHARAYKIIHHNVPRAPNGSRTMVGVAQAYPYLAPWGSLALGGLYERLATFLARRLTYEAWDDALTRGRRSSLQGGGYVPGLKDSYDYCGVNYYHRVSLRFRAKYWRHFGLTDKETPNGTETTQMGWQVYPEGFYRVLQYAWGKLRKPIVVTENGIADDSDTMRPRYLLQHLAALHRAIRDGIPVLGYFHWSFIDNYEWREGFAKKFGLIAVDHRDPELKRTPRKSAMLYSEIISRNAITDEMVQRFAPDLLFSLFPE